MALNTKGSNVPNICSTSAHEYQNSLRFALRSFVSRKIEYFLCFLNSGFEIFEKTNKNRKLKIYKKKYVILRESWEGKFRKSLKTSGCDL